MLYLFHSIPVDRFDLLFLIQQVFKQRSIFSGTSIAGAKLELTRWDIHQLPSLNNLVLGTVEECKKHEQEGLEGMDPTERQRIQTVLDMLATMEGRNECYY